MDELTQLYPSPTRTRPLPGTYLAHNIQQLARGHDRPFVYANFVTSLDGRIAIPDEAGLTVPRTIANERDWRLFQELAAQADILISSGRYLREWAEGRAQEILRLDDPRFADLRAWRQAQGLSPQPDLAIVSRTLDFPIPELLREGGRQVVIFTTSRPDPRRVAEIEAQAGQVLIAGDQQVMGEQMIAHLGQLGYRAVYSAAGPKILHLLVQGGVLDRLYLTFANRLLGGDPLATIVDGPLFTPAAAFTLHELYFDAVGLDGLGQLFATYNQIHSP